MTEAEEKKLEVAEKHDRKDANEEIPAWADALSKRFDAVEKRLDCMETDRKDTRKDERDEGEDPEETTEGKKRSDESRKEEEHRAGELAAKAEEEKRKEDRRDRKDEGEEKRRPAEASDRKDAHKEDRHARKDEGDTDKDTDREDRRDREDRARADRNSLVENRELKAKLAEMERRVASLYAEPSIEDRNALADARSRADTLYQALQGVPASAPQPGENPISYRKRICAGLQKYSDKLKDIRVDSLTGQAFDVIEANIYADAQAAIRSDAIVQAGTLRPIKTNRNGHEYTEYVGDTRATWDPFTMGTIHTVKFGPRPDAH